MKVAYWPGCVSRGFTPELHGSMAKVAPLQHARSSATSSMSSRGATLAIEPCSSGVKPRLTQPGQ